MTRSSSFSRTPSAAEDLDRGDTLVEVLVAVVIIGMAVTALLGTLLTTTTASIDHRATASFNAYLASFAETARNQIEFPGASGASSGFAACTAGYNLVGAPIPHTGPVGTSVAVLGAGFTPVSANISGTSASQSVSVGPPITTPTAPGFIAQFNLPSMPAGSYTISLVDDQGVSHAVASSFLLTGAPPVTQPPAFNNYDSFTVTTSYWDSSWTTDQTKCNGSNYNSNIQQLSFALTDDQPNNGAGSVQTITVSNLSPQGLPAPPSGLSATTSVSTPGGLELSWFAPTYQGTASVTSYNVYRSTSPWSPQSPLGSPADPPVTCSSSPCQYLDTNGLTAGTNYYYVVTAVSKAGESQPSTQATATTPTAPSAPQGFTVNPTNSSGSLQLSWAAPASTGGLPITYRIYRSMTAIQPAKWSYTSSCASNCIFTDSGLFSGNTYNYWVTAVNGVGESPAAFGSAEAGAPGAPTSLVASATSGSGSVTLKWSAPSTTGGSSIAKYNIYRSTTSGTQGAQIGSVTIPTVTYQDTVPSGTTYYYEITAVNTANIESEPSNQAQATP